MFDGLQSHLGNIHRLSRARSRSISPESFTGEKGRGGMATSGTGSWAARELGPPWKISPSIKVAAKSTVTLADIAGPGAIQQIWMTPTFNCYWPMPFRRRCRITMEKLDDIRVTIQVLGWRSEHRYLPLQDDVASIAFWYQTLPTAPFPALPSKDHPEII